MTLSYTNLVPRTFSLAWGLGKDPGSEVVHVRYLLLEMVPRFIHQNK